MDDGRTVLTSPEFDLTNHIDPVLSYYRWFFNGGGSGSPNDSLIVRLHNGTTTVVLEVVKASSAGNSSWVQKTFDVASLITPSATMRISFDAVDASPGHIVEAGVDKFEIKGDIINSINNANFESNGLNVYPNPFTDKFHADYKLKNDIQTGARFVVSDIAGRVVFEKAIYQKEGTAELNVNPAPGFYFVKIINGDEKTPVIKLIKN